LIVLSQAFLDKGHPVDVAKTLIHEASHAVHASRDFFYVDSRGLKETSTAQDIVSYVNRGMRSSRRLFETGPDEAAMKVMDKMRYSKIMGFDPNSITSPEAQKTRRDLFINTPVKAVQVVLNNADSIATFVVSVHHVASTQRSTSTPGSVGKRFSRL
jgi:hypothetical protein